jgi:hypothetical protein
MTIKQMRKGRLIIFIVVVAGLASAVALTPLHGWLGLGRSQPALDREADDRSPGFHERALQSGLDFRMRFLPTEQGEKFKINLYDHGCGVTVGDYDGDGFDDIYFCNQLGNNALFRNRGDGTFVDVTRQAGVGLGDRICAGATFADTLNKGRQDLFVTSTRGGNIFFRNQGNGTFKDATEEAGLSHVGHSHTAVFFDYDNDGYLDLLVTNTAQWTKAAANPGRYYPGKTLGGLLDDDFLASPKEDNILYHNNGDGTFTDVTARAGLAGRGWSGDIAVLDYNDDGHFDVLISNMFGPTQLYRNNGDGTFTDVTREVLGRTSYGCIGAKVFDFNNDGKLDLFLADMHSDMWMGLDSRHSSQELATRTQKVKFQHILGPYVEGNPSFKDMDKKMEDLLNFRLEEVLFGNTLFKNLGKGKFQEMSEAANLETFWPWGVATGDFDNDGYEDVFLPSGMGYPFWYWPNHLMMNNGNETFTQRAEELGIEPPERGLYLEEQVGGQPACRSSRCAAVADFDRDGRLDLITNNFNDYPYYYRNHLPRKNYVAFRLHGTKSNRDAIGAVVHLYAGKDVMTRQVNPAGGYLSQSSKTLHFGLGNRSKIDRLEIRWPSGIKQVISGPAINQWHEIREAAN